MTKTARIPCRTAFESFASITTLRPLNNNNSVTKNAWNSHHLRKYCTSLNIENGNHDELYKTKNRIMHITLFCESVANVKFSYFQCGTMLPNLLCYHLSHLCMEFHKEKSLPEPREAANRIVNMLFVALGMMQVITTQSIQTRERIL